jgi:hypothetical protein
MHRRDPLANQPPRDAPLAKTPRWLLSVLSFGIGHSIDYLTNQVAAGREAYYSDAVAAGEPPGRWSGVGAVALGLGA